MDNIQYDPERILNGFTENILREVAKKLKRRIRSTKEDIIQDILSSPKGKSEDWVKVWQEINRHLRKELDSISQETFLMYSTGDVPITEQFKVGYMFTLSPNPEIRIKGEELYCQAEENKELEKNVKEEAVAAFAMITAEIEAQDTEEAIETRGNEEMIEAIEAIELKETIEDREAIEMSITGTSCSRVASAETRVSAEKGIEETEELYKKIRSLENKLRKANIEGLRTKGQLEKMKNEMIAIKSQWVREKEETGKYRNRVRELEGEREEKEKEIDKLKMKIEQIKSVSLQKTKEESQRKDSQKVKGQVCGEIDLASYQGRKALIFAERDHEIDLRLSALGIIPIWAMEIDWNRPRRRMSTCELVLYKQNDKMIKKLDEIRDIARYRNIPCDELLNISGRIVHD